MTRRVAPPPGRRSPSQGQPGQGDPWLEPGTEPRRRLPKDGSVSEGTWGSCCYLGAPCKGMKGVLWGFSNLLMPLPSHPCQAPSSETPGVITKPPPSEP